MNLYADYLHCHGPRGPHAREPQEGVAERGAEQGGDVGVPMLDRDAPHEREHGGGGGGLQAVCANRSVAADDHGDRVRQRKIVQARARSAAEKGEKGEPRKIKFTDLLALNGHEKSRETLRDVQLESKARAPRGRGAR